MGNLGEFPTSSLPLAQCEEGGGKRRCRITGGNKPLVSTLRNYPIEERDRHRERAVSRINGAEKLGQKSQDGDRCAGTYLVSRMQFFPYRILRN